MYIIKQTPGELKQSYACSGEMIVIAVELVRKFPFLVKITCIR
jgi:hypothetical protein